MKRPISIVVAAVAILGLGSPAWACTGTWTATATFTAATDTTKPTNDTSPRGTVKFSQSGKGPVTAVGDVTGLTPNRAYLAVPYKDGGCAPTPGVTAFPSSTWVTDSTGHGVFSVTVNPQAVNPLGMFRVKQTKSISIREVLVPGQTTPLPGPVTVPTVPNPITEACDRAPVVVKTKA